MTVHIEKILLLLSFTPLLIITIDLKLILQSYNTLPQFCTIQKVWQKNKIMTVTLDTMKRGITEKINTKSFWMDH